MSIQKGAVGVRFQRTIKDETGAAIDISTATIKQIVFVAPNGVRVAQASTFLTDGTDGVHYYDTLAGDLSLPGVWLTQSYVELSGGAVIPTSVTTFDVRDNL